MIGAALSIAAAGAKVAAEIAEKSKNGQLLDAGEAKANADNWKAVNEQLAAFKRAADAIDDPAVRKLLRDDYTTD